MFKFTISIFFFMILFACNEGEKVRRYQEKASALKENEKISTPMEKAKTRNMAWETPPGWIEKKGRGIRLATFDISSGDQFALCTIVPLQGDGGGIKANVLRWLSQMDLKLGSDKELDDFILKQKRFTTEQKIPGALIDFTSLVQSPEQQTMLALILTLPHETLFVKMTGKKMVLIKNREKFMSLGHSIRIVKQ